MSKYPAVQQLLMKALGERPPKGTSKRLAEAVGVKPATVSRWLSGQSRIDSGYWADLAQALNVDEDEIRRAVNGGDDPADHVAANDIIDRLDELQTAVLTAVNDAFATRDKQQAEVGKTMKSMIATMRSMREELSALSEHQPAP